MNAGYQKVQRSIKISFIAAFAWVFILNCQAEVNDTQNAALAALPVSLSWSLAGSELTVNIESKINTPIYVRKIDPQEIFWGISIVQQSGGRISLQDIGNRTTIFSSGRPSLQKQYETALSEMNDPSKFIPVKPREVISFKLDLNGVIGKYRDALAKFGEDPKVLVHAEVEKLVLIPKVHSSQDLDAIGAFQTKYYSDPLLFANGVWSKLNEPGAK